MPKSCCVPLCTTNRLKNYNLKFYILPNIKTEPKRRRKWLEAIDRKDESGNLWDPATRHVYVCGLHFVSGFKNEAKDHPDYVPSVFPARETSASDELQSLQTPVKEEVKMEVPDPNTPEDGDMACKTLDTGSSTSNTGKKKSQEVCDKSRTDTALAVLTRRFMELVQSSHDGILDLNVASLQLNVSKRRIYDVINVLEGISLLKKKSKNYVEWAGGEGTLKDTQLMTLAQQEDRLDHLIEHCRQQLHWVFKNHHSRRFAYLTYEDVKNIPCLKEQTVMVIKAPAETVMAVPHPEKSLQVHLSSTQGPIDVFMCSDDPMPEDCGCLTDGDNPTHSVPYAPSVQVSSRDDVSHNSGLSRASILRPEPTQHSSPVNVTSSPPLSAHLPRPTKLVTPSPLRSSEGYLLGLVKDEGVTDPAPLDIV